MMNGILTNQEIVLPGHGSIDYFLFSERFEPSFEEMINGEIRADWEDEDDDQETEEIMGFTPDCEGFVEDSPIKIELTIKVNLSINGKNIDLQIGSLGEDSHASINKEQTTRSPLHGEDEFSGAVLRV